MPQGRYDDPIWGDLFREADEEFDRICAEGKAKLEKKHGKLPKGYVWGSKKGKGVEAAQLVPTPDPSEFLKKLGEPMQTPRTTPGQRSRTPQGAVPKPSSPDDMVKSILAPLKRVASALEDKWGKDRLCSLVDEEMASRFASAAKKLDEAIHSNDIELIRKKAEVMRKGWMKLDALAEQAGHEPWEQGDVWEGRRPDGSVFLIAKHRTTAIAEHKKAGVGVWTLDEIGQLIQTHDPDGFTQAMKNEFDAELISCNPKPDDGLPF